MPTAQHIRSAIHAYFDCFSRRDIDGIVALFAADAWIEDPVGQPRTQGTAALREFFSKGFEQSGGIALQAEGAVRIAGNIGACAAIGICANATPPFRFETLDVMTFDENGRIISMLAYWGESNFHPLDDLVV